MENMLETIVENFKVFRASQEYDKEALREAHEKSLRQMESARGLHQARITRRKASEHWRPSVPLKGLQPIRVRELECDKHHKGRALFGTLSVHSFTMVGIMTLLEDQFGDAVRLTIYNTDKVYPKGSKVAVKQPYFKQGAADGILMVRVDNPEDVQILASFPGNAPKSSLAKDLLELRSEGNKHFRSEDWNKAIDCYTRCIDLALSRDKIETHFPSASNIEEKVKEALLYSYSNRAEAKLRLNQYGDAVEDCDKALALDHHHFKSLYRKGRAFYYLREYKLARQCFDCALEQTPTATEIQLLCEKSKELNNQNQHGKFDLSTYFINACNAPELSNYIGPVLIKKSIGRGRGLFATDNVDIGDFLLVDNAIASCRTEVTRLKGNPERVMPCIMEVNTKLGHLKRDLEAKIISCAVLSPRVLQQLQYLADSDEMKVPPMDLFRINNASWNNFYGCNQDWEIDHHKLGRVMRNVGCQIQTMESNSDMSRQNEHYGLWVLPSFINHSCLPNANCIVVGEAMFIIAARKIAAGEEITIPYFDTLIPLFRRECAFRTMEFKCDCKRCMLERSLVTAEESPLQDIAEIFESTEPSMLSDLELWASAIQVENIIAGMPVEEKQMIRASYFPLYYNIFGLGRIHPIANTTLPSLREVFDGIQEVVPGNCMCFELFGRFPVYAKNEDETKRVLLKKALEVCRAYMGKHEERLLEGVLKSVATDFFKPGLTMFGMTGMTPLNS